MVVGPQGKSRVEGDGGAVSVKGERCGTSLSWAHKFKKR